MSSADKQKHGSLEQEFWRRLHDAEAQPAPDIWSRIDHELTVQENSKYKNRLLFYRQLAAACITLLMVAGAGLLYHFRQDSINTNGVQPGIAANTGTSEQTQKSAASQNGSIDSDKSIAADASINNPSSATEQSMAGTATESIALADAPAQNTRPQISGTGIHTSAKEHKPATGNYTSGSIASIDATTPQVNQATSLAHNTTVAVGATTTEQDKLLLQPQPGSVFPSARQAIAAVPSSYYKTAAQQLLLNPAAKSEAAKSVEEQLQQGSIKLQKQNEALVLALNNEAGGSSEKDVTGNKSSRWNVSMSYAPSYFEQNIGLPEAMMGAVNQRSLTAKGPSITSATSDNMEEARDEFAKNTKPAFSYSVDVKAGFKLRNKLKLLTGIGYSQNSARTKTSYVLKQFLFRPYSNERSQLAPSTVFLPALNNNFTTDSISVAQTDAFDVDYRYEFLSVPLGLQYEGNIAKNWYWYAAGGMAANFLMKTSIEADTKDVQSVEYRKDAESPFRRMQFSGNMSMGVGKRISDAVTISFGPEMRSFLSTLLEDPNKAVATQGKPYSLGLNMAVNYQLGKK